ncbi:MAG: hypothetical protein ACI4UO_06930 [Paludibacteraceae bacterium]
MSEKDKYIREYLHFAEQFFEQNETYTASDWDAAQLRYSQLRDQYATHMVDMSREERQTIDAINSKIDAVFVRYELNNAATQLESIINEGKGLLEELLK